MWRLYHCAFPPVPSVPTTRRMPGPDRSSRPKSRRCSRASTPCSPKPRDWTAPSRNASNAIAATIRRPPTPTADTGQPPNSMTSTAHTTRTRPCSMPNAPSTTPASWAATTSSTTWSSTAAIYSRPQACSLRPTTASAPCPPTPCRCAWPPNTSSVCSFSTTTATSTPASPEIRTRARGLSTASSPRCVPTCAPTAQTTA